MPIKFASSYTIPPYSHFHILVIDVFLLQTNGNCKRLPDNVPPMEPLDLESMLKESKGMRSHINSTRILGTKQCKRLFVIFSH